MDDGITIKIDDKALRKELRRFGKKAENGTKPLTHFYQWWKLTVSAAWNKVKATGGIFRGVEWPAMKDQYKRKDGTVVPAWGGVPYAKSTEVTRNGRTFTRRFKRRGKVKGRSRQGRKNVRVRRTDVLNADTGRLRSAVLAARPRILRRAILRIGGDLPAYATHVFRELKRNPLFFKKPDDQRAINKAGRWFFDLLARDFNRRGR